jgi:hypothetical protein
VRPFYEFGVLHGASSNGVDDGQGYMGAEVDCHDIGYMMVCCVRSQTLGRGMATGKSDKIGRGLVDAHGRVACAAAGGERTVIASPTGPPLNAASFQPSCGRIICGENSFAGCVLCIPVC